MKISLLVPSRERINLKLTLISSLISTCNDIKNIELIFGTDDDDPKKDLIERICNNLSFVKNINIQNNKKFIGINKIWNTLYEHAEGDIIGYIGDDMIFKTPGWDSMIIDEFVGDNLPDDNYKLVHCYDGFREKDEICVNAFTTRKYYEITGYFTRPEFLINWSDQWMYQSYKAFDRVKYRRDIHIHHNHWILNEKFKLPGYRNSDNVAKRMHDTLETAGIDGEGNIEQYSNRCWVDLIPEHIKEVNKISKVLDIDPNWDVVDTRYPSTVEI
jgi:hypothetical protein